MGVVAKRPIANAAWTRAEAPVETAAEPAFVVAPIRAYWERLAELRYPSLAEDAACRALRFTLSIPGVHVAILGTTRPGRFEDMARRLGETGALGEDDHRAIRARWTEIARPDWVGQP
jgi:aryl-alcohol dehydrogenase-like predicted oxidoreductase